MAGMNAARVAIAINNLYSTDATLGVVWWAVVRRALHQPSAQAARDAIAASPIGSVTVDGMPVTLEATPSGTFRAARVPVSAGQHTIDCPTRCGVEVYGYSDAVSYMFAGGLDLLPIVLVHP
jgi:hypothetical protein